MTAPSLLIGHSGFVGSTLLRQTRFDMMVRSTNVSDICGKSFGLVVCAGAPAKKWLANQKPEEDQASLSQLQQALEGIRHCERFVLISTVDVYENPFAVTEALPPPMPSQAYGAHRLGLERFVRQRFPDAYITRLPGLVGPGLRKNALYDLCHNNQIDALQPASEFQFYPLVNLWADLTRQMELQLRLLHLTAAPLRLGDIASDVFGRRLGPSTAAVARYDFRSIHAEAMGGSGDYQYSAREALLAIRAYAQSGGATSMEH